MGSSRARRNESQPGRQPVVVADLADLRGPASGTLELPTRLFWQPDRTFDLDDPDTLRWMYENVLRDAIRPDELTAFLNKDRLVAVWPDLWLPEGVRRAWEDQHLVLRRAAGSVMARLRERFAEPPPGSADPLQPGAHALADSVDAVDGDVAV